MLTFPARISLSLVLGFGSWFFYPLPAPHPDLEPLLYIVSVQSPALFGVFRLTTYVAPALVALVLLMVSDAVIRTWASALIRVRTRGKLPPWPTAPTDPAPALVIGEKHHPTELRETSHPEWCVMPEKGLYTGLIIFGAIGTGKTTACMNPFTRQLLSWQADDPDRRCAALVLEVKGDFCYDVQDMLRKYDRWDDYMELSLDPATGWRWNPLDAPWIDSYSLAYTMASLVNQLFGSGKEPFWQQAYTSTMRWIIEIYRTRPGAWFTLADLYSAMVDRELLAQLVQENERQTYDRYLYEVSISAADYEEYGEALSNVRVTRDDIEAAKNAPVVPGQKSFLPPEAALKPGESEAVVKVGWRQDRKHYVAQVKDVAYMAFCWAAVSREVQFSDTCLEAPDPVELKRTREIGRWYRSSWLNLDEKLRSSIVIGISVFLDLFVTPEVSRVFCPPDPKDLSEEERVKQRRMPHLRKAIEDGKVLALNLPAGGNAALARAVGAMLKQAWLSTLLLRPKDMKLDLAKAKEERRPPKFWRPAVFICDEYQAFATCGEDDPGGDEKAFALTRQSRCIPIVATQSISSLKATLGDGESWRALIQTLRSRIFMSLADDASLKTASELLGEVNRLKASYSLSENTGKANPSLLTGKVGGGTASAGISKSYQHTREALFHQRDLNLLGTCQAIAQIFDGRVVRDAHRVYLKPCYLPRDFPYWRAFREGRL